MANYKANSENSKNVILKLDNQKLGELRYQKWYSFNAEIELVEGEKYQLEPKGFWDAKIELKKGSKILLDFKMGWKGIMIRTFFNQKEETYLLKQSGVLHIKFILIDVDKIELMEVESDFQWSKMNYNYNIKTTEKFDQFQQKELLMLTVLHCINYHMTIIAAAS